jgi:hypothetical protein
MKLMALITIESVGHISKPQGRLRTVTVTSAIAAFDGSAAVTRLFPYACHQIRRFIDIGQGGTDGTYACLLDQLWQAPQAAPPKGVDELSELVLLPPRL